MAADGSVVIEILGDAKDITSKLTGIAGGAVKTLTAAIAGVGTALSGVSAAAIKVGAGFEQSMSQVAATMGLSVEEIQNGSAEFELLSQAAKDAGAKTAFSASEAAAALNYLALAGYDAATSAEVLPSVLNLAAAGGMDLAYASDLATDAMAALGIEASKANLESFGDQLAAAASNANASVSQLGEAILVVGGTAKSLAGGTTELNAALGVLANRGIKGAEGGTALRNIILSLSAPTDKAAKLMQELGVSVYDAEGKMRPLNETFKDLNAAMQGMTEGEKTNVLNEIFNKVDLKSAQALLAGTGAEFDDLADAISNSHGAMEDMAAVQLDNLNGDITILKSGLEGLGIALYETMQVNARSAVQSITGAVGAISEALTSGGIPAAIQVAGQQIAHFATAIAQQAPAVISSSVSLIQSFLQGIRDNLPALVSAALDIVSSLATGILEFAPDLASTGIQIILDLADGIISAIPQIAGQLPQVITRIANFITENLPILTKKGIELLNALADGMFSDIPGLISVILDALIAISGSVLENAGLLVDAGLNIVMSIVQGLINSIPTLIEKVPIIVSNIANIINENAQKLLFAGIELIGQLVIGLVQAIPTLIANIPQIVTAVIDVWEAVNWLNLGKTIITGIKNGINSMLSTIKTSSESILNRIIDIIKTLPQKLFEIGKNGIKFLVDGIKSMISFLQTGSSNVLHTVINTLFSLPQRLFQLGKNAIQLLSNGIRALIPTLKSAAINIFNTVRDNLKSLPSKVFDIGKDVVKGLWNGISDMAGWVADKIQGFGEGVLNSLKDFFGIKSPSRVMRDQVGKMLGEGVAEGITDSTSDAVDSANRMAKDVQDALKSNLLDGVDIGNVSDQLRAAVNAESSNLTARLTVASNAPAEARAARDSRVAAQNAAANAAASGGTNQSTFALNIDGKEFYRGTLDSLRTVERENPETMDDE